VLKLGFFYKKKSPETEFLQGIRPGKARFLREQVKRANEVPENLWISLQRARWERQDFGGEGIVE
jgi:hypothetical protein